MSGESLPDGPRGASRTAIGVAALRWLHQTIDGEPKILVDPVAGALLGERVIQAITSDLDKARTPGAAALRAHVVLRSRYSEDRLAAATGRGVSQLVILGAGLDTFAYRQPAWARGLRIYEVDHPASQADKLRLLSRARIPVPDNVTFVAIDFEATSLADGLNGARVDFAKATFFSCLGVLMYLSETAVDALFRLVVSFPTGSEIAFTYLDAADPDSALGERVGALGEPFTFRIDHDALARKLRAMGFLDLEELDLRDADRRYFAARRDGLRAPTRRGIAAAVVGGAGAE